MPVEKRRELLLESAFRVIASRGVDGATTRAISAEAGVTLSTFHYVFASRDDLLAALVTRGTDTELAVIATALGAAAAGAERGPGGIRIMLQESLSGYIDGVVADPGREQAMISLNQYARQTSGLAELGANMYQRYYDAIADGLDVAADQAGVRWDRPTAELAPLVVAATDGITLAYLNTRDRGICDRIAEATVTLMLGHVDTTTDHR
ncbi:TetR/AcrR family transcriptional regulator [Gordonia sp. OPL2]|uniref:TetR/AcrR family transcriptional regulator n=1 Tax=Gordonia sp. OPL2 TaxID=2486274 RepID=UPI0016561AA5|nr:TetR family transcriptional regulator [Gordonia sp. OPL2]RPA12669.1 TetR family transcriptional regulator [Gordonia sp. OPL2]